MYPPSLQIYQEHTKFYKSTTALILTSFHSNKYQNHVRCQRITQINTFQFLINGILHFENSRLGWHSLRHTGIFTFNNLSSAAHGVTTHHAGTCLPSAGSSHSSLFWSYPMIPEANLQKQHQKLQHNSHRLSSDVSGPLLTCFWTIV
jgi:hypothetical protein